MQPPAVEVPGAAQNLGIYEKLEQQTAVIRNQARCAGLLFPSVRARTVGVVAISIAALLRNDIIWRRRDWMIVHFSCVSRKMSCEVQTAIPLLSLSFRKRTDSQ